MKQVKQLFYIPSRNAVELIQKASNRTQWLDHSRLGPQAKHHSPEAIRALGKIGGNKTTCWGKTHFHLARLASNDHNSVEKVGNYPADVERRFAFDFINHARKKPNTEEERLLYLAVGGEGLGVSRFWTFAPYLSHEIKRLGYGAKDSIRIILEWARDSLDKNTFETVALAGELKGLQELRNQHFYLEREADGQEYSVHTAVAAIASEFAPTLADYYAPRLGIKPKK